MKPATEQDLRACLDLLNEREGTVFRMEMCRGDRGKARIGQGWFTIPPHVFKYDWAYGVAYVCHEFAHLLKGRGGHGPDFQKIEDRLCALFGLSVERAKAYPRAILANGQVAWGWSAHPGETPEQRARRLKRNEVSRRSKSKARLVSVHDRWLRQRDGYSD